MKQVEFKAAGETARQSEFVCINAKRVDYFYSMTAEVTVIIMQSRSLYVNASYVEVFEALQ